MARCSTLRWEAPPLAVREINAFLARLAALETDLRRELNQQEKAPVSGAPWLVQESLTAQMALLRKEIARVQAAIDDHIHPTLRQDKERLCAQAARLGGQPSLSIETSVAGLKCALIAATNNAQDILQGNGTLD